MTLSEKPAMPKPLAAAFIVLLTLAVYIPAMRGGFVWNDEEVGSLSRNIVLEEDGLRRVWFTTESVNYWPVTWTSFWIEHQFWDLNPTGYHVVNVLIHAACALLVWGVLRRLKVPGAWLAALIFAVHPVNVESAAWITQRKNTLSLFFVLLALLWYLDFDSGGKRRWYWIAVVAFLAAMLSKGAAATLPVVLLLIAWYRRGRITKRDVLRSVAFFVVALAMSGVEIWFQYVKAIGEDVVRDDSFMARFAGAGWVAWHYFCKAALPIRTCFIYSRWTVDAAAWTAYLPNLAWLIVFGVGWRFRKTWGRHLVFALACYAVTLGPVLGFLDIYFMRYSLVADHYQYMSIAAVIALLVAAGAGLLNRLSPSSRAPHWLIAAPLVVALCALTWRQAEAYENVETLWRDTLRKNPDAWIAHSELATHLVSRGELDEAFGHFETALRLHPDSETYNNLGSALIARRRVEEALLQYRAALKLNPKYAESHLNLGVALRNLGQKDEALVHLFAAVECSPLNPRARVALATLLIEVGRGAEALEHLRAAVELQPDDPDAQRSLALTLVSTGRLEESVPHFLRLIELEPDAARAHYNLGGVLKALGRGREALPHLRKALELNPDWPEALAQTAWILACDPDDRLRDPDEALRFAEKAATLSDRSDPQVLDALAAAYASVGRYEDASNTCLLALSLMDAESRELRGGELRRRLALYRQQQPYRLKPRESRLSPFNP